MEPITKNYTVLGSGAGWYTTCHEPNAQWLAQQGYAQMVEIIKLSDDPNEPHNELDYLVRANGGDRAVWHDHTPQVEQQGVRKMNKFEIAVKEYFGERYKALHGTPPKGANLWRFATDAPNNSERVYSVRGYWIHNNHDYFLMSDKEEDACEQVAYWGAWYGTGEKGMEHYDQYGAGHSGFEKWRRDHES